MSHTTHLAHESHENDEALQIQAVPQTSLLDDLIPPDNRPVRYALAAALLILALVSFFGVARWAGSPETYASTIASLDEKKATVTSLITGSTGTSAAITLLPGDVGTPIAEKLLDIGGDFAIVIGAIYLEKYLLTTLGLAAFKILIPLACILFALALVPGGNVRLKQLFLTAAARLALFGLAMFLVVPASVFVSDQIEATYDASVAASLAAATEAQEAAEQSTQEQDNTDQTEAQTGSAGLLDMIQQIPESIQQIPENLQQAATGVSQEVQDTLNAFIETLAVMIVTSCVIPILVLLFFLWLAQTILGIRIETPMHVNPSHLLSGRRSRR